MSQTILPTDLFVQGNLSSKTLTAPAGSITDAAIAGAAGIAASKLQQQFSEHYVQANGASIVSATVPLHVIFGATATIVQFAAGVITPAVGNDTVTVDLRKNGSTVLSSVITLSVAGTTNVARTLYTPAGFISTALVVGDWLDVVVVATHNTGTLAQGLYVRLVHREDAQ